jgi:hypothetical protein
MTSATRVKAKRAQRLERSSFSPELMFASPKDDAAVNTTVAMARVRKAGWEKKDAPPKDGQRELVNHNRGGED